MVGTTDNLDKQLGVKKLVPIHSSTRANTMTTSASLNKLRHNHSADHWSSNNGSVIYAQPATNHHSSNKYLKATNGTQNVLVESRKVKGSLRYNLAEPENERSSGLKNPHYRSLNQEMTCDSNGICGEDLSGEDLKSKTESNKWSNGSGTTSDLLF
jgi:hypothetical protein